MTTCESITAKYVRDGAPPETVLKAQIRSFAEADKLLKRPHHKHVILEDRVYQTLMEIYGTRSNDYAT